MQSATETRYTPSFVGLALLRMGGPRAFTPLARRGKPWPCDALTPRPDSALRPLNWSRRMEPELMRAMPLSLKGLGPSLVHVAGGAAMVRSGIAEIANRPQQRGGWRGRAFQGCDGAASQSAPSHDQGRSAQSEARIGEQPLLSQHSGSAVDSE